MAIVEYKECDVCGRRRQIKPIMVGGGWTNEYKLSHSNPVGHTTVNLCSNNCLCIYSNKIIKESNKDEH